MHKLIVEDGKHFTLILKPRKKKTHLNMINAKHFCINKYLIINIHVNLEVSNAEDFLGWIFSVFSRI
jgi:hypothetical protein